MSRDNKFKMRNQRIIKTAENLIKQKGYHHFKMSDISDELDIAKGTIYNHYRSKEDLLFVIVYPKMVRLRDSLREVSLEKAQFKHKFESIIRIALESDYHQFLLLSYSDMAVLFQEKNQTEMERIQNEIIQEFRNVLAQGIQEGVVRKNLSVDFLSHQILLTLNPLLHSLLVTDSSKMSHEEYVEQTIDLLLHGIQGG